MELDASTLDASTSYDQGFKHGKEIKLKEILPFQAREHSLFLEAQSNFYKSFLDTITEILPSFKLSHSKITK